MLRFQFARLFWLISSISLGWIVAQNTASGQINPDGTVPTNIDRQGNVFHIEGGITAGENLFHSFGEFSLPEGNEAYFNNSDRITNIITRVTGGLISHIDGLIRANGNANLFLINPSGIIFGPNAALNIGGSFYASSADSVVFADGTVFSAKNAQGQPLLTINVPFGLQLGQNAGTIVNQSRMGADSGGEIVGLQVNPGQTLALIGGNISLNGGGLLAAGGKVELGGLMEAGTVTLNSDGSLSFPTSVQLSNVSLSDEARIDVTASSNDGSITVNATNVEILNSEIAAGIELGVANPEDRAGEIEINATSVSVTDST